MTTATTRRAIFGAVAACPLVAATGTATNSDTDLFEAYRAWQAAERARDAAALAATKAYHQVDQSFPPALLVRPDDWHAWAREPGQVFSRDQVESWRDGLARGSALSLAGPLRKKYQSRARAVVAAWDGRLARIEREMQHHRVRELDQAEDAAVCRLDEAEDAFFNRPPRTAAGLKLKADACVQIISRFDRNYVQVLLSKVLADALKLMGAN